MTQNEIDRRVRELRMVTEFAFRTRNVGLIKEVAQEFERLISLMPTKAEGGIGIDFSGCRPGR